MSAASRAASATETPLSPDPEVPVRSSMLVVVLLLAVPAQASEGCQTRECAERVARRNCSQANVPACIRRAALHHRVSERLLRRIIRCESSNRKHPHGNPRARNRSGSSGLAQFLPSTWRLTPYRDRWILSVKWNPLGAAWLMRREGTRPWNASRRCWRPGSVSPFAFR
jgi:soluble lytic murein transglycosylase-like protein